MAWIESHTELSRHPKFILLKKKMRWSKHEALGFLHDLWHTVLMYAPNGVISALNSDVLSETLGITVEAYDKAAAALEETGFLDRRGDIVLVHDWIDYASRYLRDTKYRNHPEKWRQICDLHKFTPSAENRLIIGGNTPYQPTLTNQPTHLPTRVEREKERLRKKSAEKNGDS
jgi:hypothetical protein